MSLLGDLIINILARACLKYQRSRHATLSPIPTTPIYTTPTAPAMPMTFITPTTLKTFPLPFTPKTP